VTSVSEEITKRLAAIEAEANVCIFYACESGSRAWGFPSADSDYDVRFLYLHPVDWYLSIDQRRDVIEKPIHDLIDLNGWDLRKALLLFRKSNPPLLEWLQSPIVYQERHSIVNRLRELVPEFYSPKASFYHYLHMAEGNHRDYLRGDMVWVKKYLYVLRPVLGCRWIERHSGAVPMEFCQLVDETLDDDALKGTIRGLVERKRSGDEMREEPRIPRISEFLDKEIERLKSVGPGLRARRTDVRRLDEVFRSSLREAFGSCRSDQE
jgi:predicted nucleotidyltransferase